MAACRSCGAAIVWARTERGKKMPIDVEPYTGDDDRGLFVLRERDHSGGPLAIAAWGLDGTEPHYRSHFGTCPNASQHRRSAA